MIAPSGTGRRWVRYRFIAETDTWEEADAIIAEIYQGIAARAL